MMCTYGYSFVALLPACILMLLPSSLWRWLVCLAGCALSCLFVKNHLWGDFISITDQRLRYSVMGLLFGTHIVIWFMYRVYFFWLLEFGAISAVLTPELGEERCGNCKEC